jgi:hypothetical protein
MIEEKPPVHVETFYFWPNSRLPFEGTMISTKPALNQLATVLPEQITVENESHQVDTPIHEGNDNSKKTASQEEQ